MVSSSVGVSFLNEAEVAARPNAVLVQQRNERHLDPSLQPSELHEERLPRSRRSRVVLFQ
jgi:hypothetical protein